MPSTLRGSDVNVWFSNRAARRKETIDILAKLRDAQSKLAAVSGTATPIGRDPIQGESVDDLLSKTAASVAEVNRIATSIAELEKVEPKERVVLINEENSVHRAAWERARRQVELTKQKATKERWARAQRKEKLRKFGIPAVAIILLILMVKC